jgi:hypothetical protein
MKEQAGAETSYVLRDNNAKADAISNKSPIDPPDFLTRGRAN